MTNPILQILIENTVTPCRFWRSNKFCRRVVLEELHRGLTYSGEPDTNCEGQILKCERSEKDLFKDPPV